MSIFDLFKRITANQDFFDSRLLHMACEKHLDRTIDFFISQGVNRDFLRDQQERWLSLLQDDIWSKTFEGSRSAWLEAKSRGVPATRSFLESGTGSRIIVVTAVPWVDEQRFARTMPSGGYAAFVKPYRDDFRRLPNWEYHDFVHWMFLVGEDISILLLYLPNLDSLRRIPVHRLHEYPIIVPLEVLPPNAAAQFMGQVMLCSL